MTKYLKPLFAIYTIIMLWLLFGQRLPHLNFTDYADKLSHNINLIPLRTVRLFFSLAKYSTDYRSVALAMRNLAGNVVLFIPLGALPLIFTRLDSFAKFILTTAAIITAVELLQFVTLLGSCDIDDLILNLIGAALGYFLMKICCKNLFFENHI